VPVVSTNVGDASETVGPAGIILARGDASTLAESWGAFLSAGRNGAPEVGMAARPSSRLGDWIKVKSLGLPTSAIIRLPAPVRTTAIAGGWDSFVCSWR
jgi:hypothetical protein